MNPTKYQLFAIRAPSKDLLSLSICAVSVGLLLLCSAVCLHAQETPAPAGASEGEKMERQMWADFKAKNWKAVESKIAEGFQSIHPDGARDPGWGNKTNRKFEPGRSHVEQFQVHGQRRQYCGDLHDCGAGND